MARAYGYGYDGANRLLFGDYVARGAAGSWDAEQQRYGLGGVRYDANGNLLALQRRGLLAPATRTASRRFGAVDELAYAYAGNRLQAVNDAVTTNQLARPAGYHGAPASLAGDFQEQGVRQGQEYGYDPNGSLTSDANKGISGIVYNHLNLPRQIHFGAGADSVVFRYAAGGQKVAKFVYQTGRPMLRTDYLGPYQYEQDSLRFFPHAEGRVLRFVNALSGAVRYEREYTIKDHLGNLRLAYRAGHRATYAATLEQDDATQKRETRQFDSLSVSPPVAQNVGGQARTGSYAARLNAGGPAPQPLGPLTQLAVQKGDTVTVVAPGYYPRAVQSGSFAFSLAGFVAGLLQAPPAPAPGYDGRRRGALPLLSLGVSAALPALLRLGGGVPQGYARLLVFDADSNLVRSETRQLSAAAGGGYEPLTVQVIAAQDGYITAYVGNESPADVYFDDVTVTLGQGLQVQETEYDPAGLELAGLAPPSPGIRSLNQYKFNGQEFQADLGLSWNHQDARFLDVQTGPRWLSVDPDPDKGGQESWSPYQFGFANAVRYQDVDGHQGGPVPGYQGDNPMFYLEAGFAQYAQNVGAFVDKFYAFFSTTTSQTMAETPRGTVAGVGVKGTSTVEVKAETKYQTTLKSYLTPNSSNHPQGSLYKATTTVKVAKVEKGELSGKVRGLDVRASGAVKTDPANGATTAVGEVSAGVSIGEKGTVNANVSVDTNGQTRNAKAGLKMDTQLSDKRKASAGAGIGFSF